MGEIACLPRDEQVPSEQLAELLRAHELDPALAPVRCLVAGLGVTIPEVPSEPFARAQWGDRGGCEIPRQEDFASAVGALPCYCMPPRLPSRLKLSHHDWQCRRAPGAGFSFRARA